MHRYLCPMHQIFLSLLFLFIHVDSQDSTDLVAYNSVPLYTSAESCVQNVLDDQYDSDYYQFQCPISGRYSCLCKDPAHSTSNTYSLRTSAVASCGDDAAGSTAVNAFVQYCTLNEQGPNGPGPDASASATGKRSSLHSTIRESFPKVNESDGIMKLGSVSTLARNPTATATDSPAQPTNVDVSNDSTTPTNSNAPAQSSGDPNSSFWTRAGGIGTIVGVILASLFSIAALWLGIITYRRKRARRGQSLYT